MSKNNNIIEINGKRYDSLTGQLLSPAGGTDSRVVDGITAPKRGAKASAKSRASQPGEPGVTKPTHTTRQPAAHLKSHAPEAAKTLMRTVAKPSQSPAKQGSPLARGSLSAPQPALQAIVPKLSLSQVDPAKLARAGRTAKSKLVSRFAPLTSSPVSTPAPPATQSSRPLTDPIPPAAPANPSQDIFERAIAASTAHQQRTGKRAARQGKPSKRRSLQVITLSLALVVIGGFAFYQNLGTIHLHMASAKAGFTANLPGYHPSGFSLGAIDAQAGKVAVNFHSNSDQRNFAISEKPSAWDSQTLLTSFVVGVAGQNYQTVQAAGNTVYIYGKNNATWVSGGIWYQVQTSGALSSQQLIELASSI